MSRPGSGVLDPSAVTVGTTTVTSKVVSVPSTITREERRRLIDFHARNGRWPEAGDGEIHDLFVRATAKADRAFVRAPRQRGEPLSAVHWRRTTASLRLRRTRGVVRGLVRPRLRQRGRARRGRRASLRRAPSRSPGGLADDPDLADPEAAA